MKVDARKANDLSINLILKPLSQVLGLMVVANQKDC